MATSKVGRLLAPGPSAAIWWILAGLWKLAMLLAKKSFGCQGSFRPELASRIQRRRSRSTDNGRSGEFQLLRISSTQAATVPAPTMLSLGNRNRRRRASCAEAKVTRVKRPNRQRSQPRPVSSDPFAPVALTPGTRPQHWPLADHRTATIAAVSLPSTLALTGGTITTR